MVIVRIRTCDRTYKVTAKLCETGYDIEIIPNAKCRPYDTAVDACGTGQCGIGNLHVPRESFAPSFTYVVSEHDVGNPSLGTASIEPPSDVVDAT